MDLDTMKTYIEDLLIERGELYERIHKAEQHAAQLEAEVARLERLVANG